MTLQAKEMLGSRKTTWKGHGPSASALGDTPWMMGALSWTTGCNLGSFSFPQDRRMGEGGGGETLRCSARSLPCCVKQHLIKAFQTFNLITCLQSRTRHPWVIRCDAFVPADRTFVEILKNHTRLKTFWVFLEGLTGAGLEQIPRTLAGTLTVLSGP